MSISATFSANGRWCWRWSYYDCPMLCTQVLNGMVRALKALTFTPGQEYDVVVVSFDARAKPPLAASKKQAMLREYGDSGVLNT